VKDFADLRLQIPIHANSQISFEQKMIKKTRVE